MSILSFQEQCGDVTFNIPFVQPWTEKIRKVLFIIVITATSLRSWYLWATLKV